MNTPPHHQEEQSHKNKKNAQQADQRDPAKRRSPVFQGRSLRPCSSFIRAAWPVALSCSLDGENKIQMQYEDHQREISTNHHRTLSATELQKRIHDLSQIGGSNPGQINQANQIVAEYRRELDRRDAATNLRWTVISAVAAIVGTIVGTIFGILSLLGRV